MDDLDKLVEELHCGITGDEYVNAEHRMGKILQRAPDATAFDNRPWPVDC